MSGQIKLMPGSFYFFCDDCGKNVLVVVEVAHEEYDYWGVTCGCGRLFVADVVDGWVTQYHSPDRKEVEKARLEEVRNRLS